MIKKKYILPLVAVACALTLIIVLKLTFSYLMDTEIADNVITVGGVDLQVSEGSFVNESVVAEGQKLEKAPQIKNTGINDEYVFFKVAVPKGYVTLLYESDVTINTTLHKEGTPIGEASSSELFKMLASSTAEKPTSEVSAVDNTKRIVFQYHSGVSTGNNKNAGWILLNTDTTDNSYNYYVFGYNKKLLAGDNTSTNTTVTLFDEIQLKSFIDEELVGNNADVRVDVTAYGIQSDNLGVGELGEYLDKSKLDEIWEILVGKQVSVANGT